MEQITGSRFEEFQKGKAGFVRRRIFKNLFEKSR